MSKPPVVQIAANLTKLFTDCIDLNDKTSHNEHERSNASLPRALPAFVAEHWESVDPGTAEAFVADGTVDNGIGCIHYSEAEQALRVVQSKCHAHGQGSIELGDLHQFVA